VPEPYSEKSASAEVPGLVRALEVLRERWWIVATCAIVSLLVAVVYVEHQPKEYTATASLQFTANSLPSQVAGVPSNQSADPEGEKSTNLQLVTTTPVAAMVVKALGLDTTPADLLGQVSATNPQNDYIIDISATERSPMLAAEIANAFAQQYVIYSQQQNKNQLVKGEQLLNKRYAQLPSTDTVDRANLRALAQKLLLLQAVQTGNARVADTAVTPTAPSSPKKKEIAGAALVVGVLLGIGLAFLLNLLDRRVKSWDEFKELYGLPELASIPQLPNKPRTASEREVALEPFRILHNSLSLLAPDHQVKTVLVTSAVAGEGKTTVACGLARAAALSGRRVILVEADLRHPSFRSQLPLREETTGLASALFYQEDPLELLQSPIPRLDRLRVLPAGRIPRNATNLLRPEALMEAIASLSSHADLIVIDSAPLLPVADTRALLGELSIDACLIVARAGKTKREEARRARAVLDQARSTGVGLVINALSEVAGGYYYGEEPTGTDTEMGDGDVTVDDDSALVDVTAKSR
jgi:capsular exopolysaccharide synthesis family protein